MLWTRFPGRDREEAEDIFVSGRIRLQMPSWQDVGES
jgi:hypothetical protein